MLPPSNYSFTNCDCRDGLWGLPSDSVDMTLSSPPYDNLRRFGDHPFTWEIFKEVASALWRVTKPGGIVCWQVGDGLIYERGIGRYSGSGMRQAVHFLDLGFWEWDRLITGTLGIRAPKYGLRYLRPPVDVFVLSKGEPPYIHLLDDRPNKHPGKRVKATIRKRDGKLRVKEMPEPTPEYGVRTTTWLYPGGLNMTKDAGIRRHFPAVMTDALARDLLLSYSRPGYTVLDPFAGGCTTGQQALLLDRRFIGFEIHPPFYEMGLLRLQVANVAAANRRLTETV